MRPAILSTILPCLLALLLAGCGPGDTPGPAAGGGEPPAAAPIGDLAGTTWSVAKLGDAAPLANSRLFLTFGPAGAASGSTGCNNFSGSAKIQGDTIAFGPVASTRRACEPALMDQEQKFLAALDAAARLQRDADGALILTAATGEALLRLVPMTGPAAP